MNLSNYNKIHFIGIGGISMSSLAEILKDKGHNITGSDTNESEITISLKNMGINVYKGHNSKNIDSSIDLIVYTAAVSENNPEIIRGKELGIKIIDRAELLGNMMKDYTYPISIAGTHGKTTTTSMITEIYLAANKNPTVSLGGILKSINGNFKIGGNEYFIVESCEYCDSFLKFNPHSAIILNIDKDHTDYFKNLDNIYKSFKKFAHRIPQNGLLVINNDIKDISTITENLKCKVLTYGLNSSAMWYADNIIFDKNGFPQYDVINNKEKIGTVKLNVVGLHNVSNSLAAFVLSYEQGIQIADIEQGLLNFNGTKRRFEYKGNFNNVTVIDDYAHHPTEIKATLEAASKKAKNNIWVAFQPHTYSRTKSLLDEFSHCFDLANNILVLDIYAAREKDTGIIHSKDLVDLMIKNGKDAKYMDSFETAKNYLLNNCKENDIVITIGAGNIYQLGDMLVNS